MRPKPARVLSVLVVLASLALSAPMAPVAAADGELDVEGFYPPSGRIGFVGGGLVADAGLVAPDGMAVAYFRGSGAQVTWRQVPPEIIAVTHCPFTPALAAEARYRDGLFDEAGRLVLVGTATLPSGDDLIFATRWLYPDCSLDTSFSGDGYFSFNLPDDVSGLRVRTQTVLVQGSPLERLLLAGDHQVAAGGPDTIVLRLDEEGALDPTFDGDGWTSLDYEGELQLLADFVVDGEGRIVFGANVDPFGADADFVVGRLSPDGVLDTTFGPDGWRRMRFTPTGADLLGAMEIAPNGDVLFAGVSDLGDERHVSVVRMGETLTQGTNFETAGDLSAVTSAVLQGDRKLVVAGWSNGFDGDFDVFALRVLVPPTGPPAVDPTFGSGGGADPLTYFSFEASAGGTDAAYGVDLSGGRPVLFGEADFGDPQGMFVARLANAYIFADGFESGDTSYW